MTLARKIFSLASKLQQAAKDVNWITLQAKESELDFDEELLYETGHGEEQRMQTNKQKNELFRLRQELKAMLTVSLELDNVGIKGNSQGRGKSKVGKGTSSSSSNNDWKRRGAGFFVYAK